MKTVVYCDKDAKKDRVKCEEVEQDAEDLPDQEAAARAAAGVAGGPRAASREG